MFYDEAAARGGVVEDDGVPRRAPPGGRSSVSRTARDVPRARRRRGQPEVGVGGRHRHPAAWGAREQTLLDEEGLVHVLHRLGELADGDGERRQADRAAVELLAERAEDRPVDLVEPDAVDPEHGQPLARGRRVDRPVAAHLGEVAHPAQQAVGDAGRAPGTTGDLPRPLGVDRDVEDSRGPEDDRLQLGGVVVVEAGDQTRSDRAAAR